ncbi:MAG: DUF4097 family beta strand repeat-containing protein [Gammaproteobacteria bacterium]
MHLSRKPLKYSIFIIITLTVLNLSGVAWAASPIINTLNQSIAVPAGASVKVENLVGHMTVTQGNGPLQVTATVVAGDSQAQTLAESVKLDVSTAGNQVTVHVHYPVNQYDTYLYNPPQAKDARTDNNNCFLVFCFNGSSSIKYQDSHVRVNENSTRGTPLYVDVAVQLPAGVKVELNNPVGRVDAQKLDNELSVKTYGADIYVVNLNGDLYADTGSGDVHVQGLKGKLKADTGSGDVNADKVTGDVSADTGSGDVSISNAVSKTLYADTGSGDVSFDHVQGDMKCDTGSGDCSLDGSNGSLHADTGSGDVTAKNYVSGDSVWADTGSGDVHLSGDLSGLRKLYIDTGSGEAVLKASTGLSMHLVASSDSGDVSVNLPGIGNVTVKDSYFSGDLGKAEGSGTISTGSGDINVSHQ